MRLLSRVTVVLVSCSALGSSASQRETPPALRLSAETSLVMLPVTVVDRRGALVPGLTQAAFTVYDNGVPQPIEFFTNEDLPATVGLVIDSSSSMHKRRQDVTVAGTAFAEFGHPLDELFTVNFNEAVWPGLPPGVVFAESIDQLTTALARAPTRGMTALYDGVSHALSRLELGTRERKVLIVVSDGGDNASTRTLDAVIEQARLMNATIFAVVVVDPDDRDARPDVVKKLAKETGGESFSPKRAADVTDAFKQIAQAIRSGYVIGFKPQDGDGGFRSIHVVVAPTDARGLAAHTRKGYYAGPSRRGAS